MIRGLGVLLVAASAALLAMTAAAQTPARARLDAFLTGVRTLEAEFAQTVRDEQGKVVETGAGRLWLWRPGRFRWEYREPHRQLIVADGDRLWVYDPDLAQATVRKLDQALGQTPAALLTSDRPVDESFEVRPAVDGGDGLDWVSLAPRASEATFREVRLGFGGGGLAAMVLLDNFGQTTRIDLLEPTYPDAVDPGLFRFEPPAGTDVIAE